MVRLQWERVGYLQFPRGRPHHVGRGSHQGSTRPLRKQRELRKHQVDFIVVLVTEQAWQGSVWVDRFGICGLE